MAVNPIREGFRSVTPYLFVNGAPQLLEFLRGAFNAELLVSESRPDSTLMHAELRIGDSMLMMADVTDGFGPMPSSIYLYVTDCDSVYEQALSAGGTSVFDVTTLPSGERYGGVRDPCGNIWWIATHVEDIPPEEQRRRWADFWR